MLGLKKNAWYAQIRYSEQHFGDYRIPTDTIVYLTQKMPVYGRKLKNTAGVERNIGFSPNISEKAIEQTIPSVMSIRRRGSFRAHTVSPTHRA